MRRWYVAVLAAAGTALVGAGAVWRARSVRDALFDRVERRLEGNAASTVAAIERWIEERRYDAATVAGEMAAVAPAAAAGGGRPSEVQLQTVARLLHRLRSGHGYLGGWIVDATDGHILAAAGAGRLVDAETRAARATVRDGRAHICDPFPLGGRFALCYAAAPAAAGGTRVELPSGQPASFAVVLRSTPFGSLFPLLHSSVVGGGSERGRLVARVGDSLVVLASSDRPTLRGIVETVPWRAAPAMLRQAVGGAVTRGLYRGADGREVVAGARHIAGTEWAIVREVDRSEIDAVVAAQVRGEVALLGAVLLALGLGIVTVARSERTRRLREIAVSEERLANTLRLSLDPVIAFDESRHITLFNAAAERTFGWSAADVIGQPVARLVSPELRAHQDAALTRLVAEPEPSIDFGDSEHAYAVRASGEVFPIEGVLTMGQAGDQRIFTLIVRDVTERRRHQAEREQSLSLLRATLESTADGILVVDGDERMTAYNRRFLDIWGIPEEIVVGGDDRAMIAHVMNGVRAPAEFAERVRALYDDPSLEAYDLIDLVDGRKLERVSRPQRIGERIVGRVWSFRDVTARELAAGALRRSEASARAFVERSPYGICRVTLDGRFMSANPALVEMLGYPSEDALLRVDLPHLYVDRAARAALVKRHDDGADVIRGEAVWRRLDGAEVPVRISSQLVRDARGTRLHHLAYVENLAPLRAVEQALRQAEKLAAVGGFVSGVAHELNNPLAAVLLFADHLAADDALGHERETVALLREQAERARAIVRDLLSFVRGSQGVADTVAADDVVASAMRALERQAAAVHAHLEVTVDEPVGWVHVDRVAIEQVLTNLVLNALQAAPGRTVRVHAAATPAAADGASALRVVVDDDGPGIPADVLPRIFEPFFTTKPVGVGTGLGLSVSLGIAERHGGTLHAENRDEGGARLVLTLPRVDAPVAASPADTAPIAPPAAGGPPRRVLLVDDEAAIRRALSRFFERRQWHVEEVADGGEALDRLLDDVGNGRDRYDLVISDLRMPGVSGIAMHDRLSDRCPELLDRLIFSTGDLVSPEAAAFVARTGCAVIEKPFRLAALDEIVTRVSRRRSA